MFFFFFLGMVSRMFQLKPKYNAAKIDCACLDLHIHKYVLISLNVLAYLRRSICVRSVRLWEYVTLTTSDRNPIEVKMNIFELLFLNCTLSTLRRASHIAQ